MDNLISKNTARLLEGLPPHVRAAAAAKTRTAGEVSQAIKGGIKIISHNYVQEAQKMLPSIGGRAKWHLIGKLQQNKVKKAIRIFDMIETVDSTALCEAIEKRCGEENIIMPVLIQVNIAGEDTKSGITPDEAARLLEETADLMHVSFEGLMTIEPFTENPEETRKYFRMMKELFDGIRSSLPAAKNFKHLSMGMSRTYKTAIEEGANIVRIGTDIFGERPARF